MFSLQLECKDYLLNVLSMNKGKNWVGKTVQSMLGINEFVLDVTRNLTYLNHQYKHRICRDCSSIHSLPRSPAPSPVAQGLSKWSNWKVSLILASRTTCAIYRVVCACDAIWRISCDNSFRWAPGLRGLSISSLFFAEVD